MAIDKSKENTRIAKLLAMSIPNKYLLCCAGINNPAILKQFLENDGFEWEYMIAAGLLEKSDVEWIKEYINPQELPHDNTGDHENPSDVPPNEQHDL